MINYVLSIETGVTDLVRTPEYYQTATFVQKKEELLALIYQKKKLKPFASMKLIRSISFFIKRSISLWQLQGLANKIETMFGPSCFQISIDRENNTVHMLCGWINKETGECIGLRYFLLNKFDNDNSVFSRQIEFLERSEYESLSYPVLRDSLKYVEMVCKGLLK